MPVMEKEFSEVEKDFSKMQILLFRICVLFYSLI